MSNPWHGEIAALSRLYLIRHNMGGTRAEGWRRRRWGGEADGEGKGGRAGATRCEEGVEGAGWGELERWRRCSYNKTGGGATFRVEGRGKRNWEEWEKRWGTLVGHLIFSLCRCIASPFLPNLHFSLFLPPPSNVLAPIFHFFYSSSLASPHTLSLSLQ